MSLRRSTRPVLARDADVYTGTNPRASCVGSTRCASVPVREVRPRVGPRKASGRYRHMNGLPNARTGGDDCLSTRPLTGCCAFLASDRVFHRRFG